MKRRNIQVLLVAMLFLVALTAANTLFAADFGDYSKKNGVLCAKMWELPAKVTVKQVEQFFAAQGKIKDVHIIYYYSPANPPGHGYASKDSHIHSACYVQFETEAAAIKASQALDMKIFLGHRVNVVPSYLIYHKGYKKQD